MSVGGGPPEFEASDPAGSTPYSSPPRYDDRIRFDSPSPGHDVPGPLGIWGTISAAGGLYAADARKLWTVLAAVIIPLQLVIFLVHVITLPSGSVVLRGKVYLASGSGGGYALGSFVAVILEVLLLLISIGAVYRILLGRHLHHPADVRTSFNFALERVGPLLWVSIVVGVCIVVGFICIIIPGIYLAVSFSLAVTVVMAEDRHGWSAAVRSRELVAGNWWHVLGCVIAGGILVAVGELIIGALVSALSPHSVVVLLLINAVFSMILYILVFPFSYAVAVVIYVDMLVRKHDPQLPRLLA